MTETEWNWQEFIMTLVGEVPTETIVERLMAEGLVADPENREAVLSHLRFWEIDDGLGRRRRSLD